MITLPHAIFIYDETGNPVPVISGSTLTSGSRGFVVYAKDGNNQARNFVVDASGNLGIQNPPNLDVSFSSRFNTLGQKSMSGSAPVVLPSDQTIIANLKQSNDAFSQPVTAGRYNQIEISFDQTDPDLITDITVTKSNGGDATNGAGQAVFSSGINTNGGVKAVSNVSVAYRPHAEIYSAFTAIFTTGIANSHQRIGIYDTNNGFFIGYEGVSFGVTIRKGGVDVATPRASFNVDTLLGSVTSKYTRNGVPESLDTTKDNLYRIRFGWLGAAPIFFEVLSPDGEWVTFHIIKHPNTTAGTSINNPDLPITLDIQKTGADATNLIMNTACWAAGTTSDLAKVSSAVTDNSLVKFVRSVLTAKQPNGSYTNIQATNGGNLKVSVQEFDPAVFGQEAMANSLPVVIASNQTVIPVNDNSGSLTIDNTFIDANLSTLLTTQQFTSSVGNVTTTPAAYTVLGRLKDIHDTTLTLLTELEFENRIGEVQTTPTANTVLGRLKNIHDTVSTLLTETTFTGSFNEFLGRLGEVQTTPTSNTVLGRLKDIEDEVIARLGTLGQKVMTGSTPVVIASDQSEYPVIQGTSASLAGAWSVKVTDGINVQPTGDSQTRAIYNYITDGLNNVVTVKTGSVSASINDNALVTAFSPNTQLPAGSNLIGGTRLYDYNDTSVRATTGQELRVAQLYVLGEFNSRYTLESYHWDTLTASNGNVVHNSLKAALDVTASANSGSSATLRTNTYFKYQCGFSQLCGMTLIHSNTGSTNQVREWGYYDDKNGYFFKLNGTSVSIVRRSNVSGTPVDTEYAQSTWNVDPMNGTGKSGMTLDVSKGNGYEIEAQCFGVGLIRFFIAGVLVHQLRFSNILNDPAMQTISLPVQVKVYNTDASSAGGIALLTCRVVAEGLTKDPFSRVYSYTNPTDISVGLTERPIMSIRPKVTFGGIDNRSWLLPLFAQVNTQGYKISYKFILNANLSGSSWTSVGPESTAEYDISATSYTGGEVIYSHFIPDDDGTDDSDLTEYFAVYGRKLRNAGFLGSGSNASDTITIVAVNEAVGTTLVRSSLSWKEVRV